MDKLSDAHPYDPHLITPRLTPLGSPIFMSPTTPASVAARLDRLPMSRFHRRFLAMVSLGGWFDMFDNFLATPLAVALPAAGVLAPAAKGEWLSSLGLFMAALPAGMFFGSMAFGLASDYVGRRLGFVAMLLLYSLASLAGGAGYYPLTWLAGSLAGATLLIASRFAAGAGIGAENVIIDAYVTEFVPKERRGRAVALTHAVAFTAMPAAALAALLLAPQENPGGWWLLLVLGSLGALFTWHFRRRLPESPRWAILHGRAEVAEAALRTIEAAVEREHGPLPEPLPAPEPPISKDKPFRIIWSPRYRSRTLMLIGFHLLQTIGYYGFMHWLGRFLLAKDFKQDEVFWMSLAASFLAPIGPLVGVWSIERWQRQRLIVGLAISLACLHVSFALAFSAWLLTALAAVIILCNNWFSAVFHAYHAELFPTEARATGIGFTYAWSRVSMGGVNLIMPALIVNYPYAPYALTAGAMLGVAVIVGTLGPLTNQRMLEEI